MKLYLLRGILPDVYKEDRSDSFEKLFNCTAKKLGYSGKISGRIGRFVFHLHIAGFNFQSNDFHSTMYGLKRIVSIGLVAFCVSLVFKEILCRKWEDDHYFNVSMIGGTVLMVRFTRRLKIILLVLTLIMDLRSVHEYCKSFFTETN